MPRIISAIIAVQASAKKRKPALTTWVATNTIAMINMGMQQATIIQL
jgi:hypothetical protein